ncbi:MAG: hypothetical protein R2795_12395 [Saprospiraceae bacterium]
MKNKIVLWGTNAADERMLVALELKVAQNKVMIYTFSEAQASDEFYQQMMDLWRDDKGEVAFPDGHQAIARELSVSESLLPDDIRVERSDVIQRAQTEWHFVVLSSKLSEAYKSEIQDLEETLAGLKEYSKDMWDSLKQFWDKVQQQAQERTLLKEHADELRDRTNKAFEDLKALRSKMDDAFRQQSKENMDRFTALLQDIDTRIKENKHLNRVFDDLKQLQRDIKDVAFTKEHRNKMWQKVDDAFKEVKEKRFGEKRETGNDSPLGRVQSRYDGLLNAIEKMERSIERDAEDLEFQQRKINTTDGQLEAQIRQAKILMIQQRYDSKKEKLDEMLKTKEQLEQRMEREKAQQAKREAQQKEEAARKEAAEKAKEKIAEDIRKQQESIQVAAEELETAALAINEQKKGKAATARQVVEEKAAEPEATTESTEETQSTAAPKAGESLLGAIGTTLGESLEDVVDTVRAVAEVVSQQFQEKVEEIKADINEALAEEE